MGKVVEALVDRNRSRFNVKRLTTILGRKNRPHHRKRKVKDWQVTVDRPSYDLTIFKLHCGAIALKIYTKGERVLRTEAMTSDARALRCGRDISQFAKAATALRLILERFLEALSCVDECFVSRDVLENLSRPTPVGSQRVGGIDINCARMRKVARSLLALSAQPFGFTCAQLASYVQEQNGGDSSPYSLRQAAYDLQKFGGKKLVGSFGSSNRRYRVLPAGLRTLSALLLLQDRLFEPLLASTVNNPSLRVQGAGNALNSVYQQLQGTMSQVLQHLGLAT